MLALDFIRTHREQVRHAIRQKGVELDLDQKLRLDTHVRTSRSPAMRRTVANQNRRP